MNYAKYLVAILLISLFLISCKSKKTACDAYSDSRKYHNKGV